MGVFSVHQAWSSKSDCSDEEFDAKGLCVGSFVQGDFVRDKSAARPSSEDEGSENNGSGDNTPRKLDSDAASKDQVQAVNIATGSLSGVLRIFSPSLKMFQVDDLELEQQLGEPILQLECGRFTSAAGAVVGEEPLSLAVLHPRSLAVYTVARSPPAEGGFLSLKLRYCHRLGSDGGEHFSAANMVCGPFGGVRGRDFIAVQSLDGQIHVFEQESFAFIRQLNDVLLPGPMAYSRKMDSLLIANSQFQVDCYKYHLLAGSSARAVVKVAGSGDGRELLQTDWTFTVGEQILDVVACRVSPGLAASQVDIFILSERSVYCLSERGVVRAHIKLDVGCNPLACVTMPLLKGADNAQEDVGAIRNVLISSERGDLSVFKEFKLVWSASMLHHLPVALKIVRIGQINGLIVSMSDDGNVAVNYMGADSSNSVLAPRRQKVMLAGKLGHTSGRGESKTSPESKEKENKRNLMDEMERTEDLEYEEMDREHRRLMAKIKSLHSNNSSQQKDSTSASQKVSTSPLIMRVQVPSTLDNLSEYDNNLAISEDPERVFAYRPDGQVVQLTLKVFITLKGRQGPLSDVHVSVSLPAPFVCADNCFVLPEIQGVSKSGRALSPTILQVPVRVKADMVLSTLDGKVTCMYKAKSGAVKTNSHDFRVGLFAGATLRSAVKNSGAKFTIDSDQPAVRLAVLFDDMLRQPGLDPDVVESVASSTSNVISFQLFTGGNATVLASKSGGRYRVQGGSLGDLWLVCEELQRRLVEKFTQQNQELELTLAEPLPLQAYLASIDRHHAGRLDVAHASSELNDRAHQYRLVQKRLLSRFKDRNAPPLRGLDTLLQVTHQQVMTLAEKLANARLENRAAQADLSAATELILSLAALKFTQLASVDMQVLRAHLSPLVAAVDGADMGWEELTDAAVTHLLRTVLAKVPKQTAPEMGAGSAALKLTLPPDASKVKRHIGILLDRLAKGARLTLLQQDNSSLG